MNMGLTLEQLGEVSHAISYYDSVLADRERMEGPYVQHRRQVLSDALDELLKMQNEGMNR